MILSDREERLNFVSEELDEPQIPDEFKDFVWRSEDEVERSIWDGKLSGQEQAMEENTREGTLQNAKQDRGNGHAEKTPRAVNQRRSTSLSPRGTSATNSSGISRASSSEISRSERTQGRSEELSTLTYSDIDLANGATETNKSIVYKPLKVFPNNDIISLNANNGTLIDLE